MRRLAPALLLTAFVACEDAVTSPSHSVDDAARFARIHEAEGSHGGTPFIAFMTPGAEIPGPGDPNANASGTIVMTLNSGQEEICFKASWQGLSAPVSNAHIHTGSATESGGVVVPLATPPLPTGTTATVAQCVPADREVIKAIRKNPELYYVNIHTSLTGAVPEPGRPAGAIRGQLGRTQGSTVNHF